MDLEKFALSKRDLTSNEITSQPFRPRNSLQLATAEEKEHFL